MRLRDKVAIVTGAAAGIGRATVAAFLREGARVAAVDRDGAALEGLPPDQSLATYTVDVRDEKAVGAMVHAVAERFGRIDVLVNNAGYGTFGTVVTTDEAAWDDVMAVNVKSVLFCSKHAIPVMAKGGGGAIVNTASNIAVVGIRDRAAYVAAKGAVAALTRAMALDHAAEHIRVNSVAPGPIASRYYDEMLRKSPDPEAFLAGLRARSPMGRLGTPEEIASLIVYLASDESAFATGAMFTVDGGMTAW
ncbi:MAG: SDR family oxidoreductase [Proteobacteria bacterium]|nr:SDR family oxidoreductase [Pseudomonadota bacterium]